MDPFLKQYYGTGAEPVAQDADSESLEKMAQLVMMDKIATEEGLDLSGLSDEEYAALAEEVFADDDGEAEAAPGEFEEPEEPEGDDIEKQAAAEIERHDFLGRVMAHAMWQELDTIQKEAAKKQHVRSGAERPSEVEFDAASWGREQRARHAREANEAKRQAAMYEGPARAGSGASGAERMTTRSEDVAEAAKDVGGKVRRKLRDIKAGAKGRAVGVGLAGKAIGRWAKRHPVAAASLAALPVATAGTTAAVMHARGKGQEKAASDGAFEELASSRAYDILAENGLVYEDGSVVTPDQFYEQPAEKTAADEFNEAVELRAWQVLQEAGYPIGE